MVLSILAIAIAAFFAANIGASGTAAAMGAAYGGGAVRKRRTAVWLAGGFAFAGAITCGSMVVATISEGIVPSAFITLEVSIILLISACLSLYYANRLGIPLSTSEVTVGSLVGVGLAFSQLYWQTLLLIVFAWLITPICAYLISYGINRLLAPLETRLAAQSGGWKKGLSLLLAACGCYEAFSAGMNNVANAVGPIIGAGLIPMWVGLLIGAASMAGGAIMLGGRVLETNGKNITELSLMQGSIVSFTGGTLVITASLFGIPVPLTQATTMAIIACGGERIGLSIFRKPIVKRIMFIWVISPLSSLILSYVLIQLFVTGSLLYAAGLLLLTIVLIMLRVTQARTGKLPPRTKKTSVLSD